MVSALKDFNIYGDDESLNKLKACVKISDGQIDQLKRSKRYSLGVSLYEYHKSFFEKDRVQKEAEYFLKKAIKRQS